MKSDNRIKKFLLCGILSAVLAPWPLSSPADQKEAGLPLLDAKDTDTAVRLNTKGRMVIATGDPGLVLFIDGWTPNGAFVVYAVDSEGRQVAIIPKKNARHVSPEGSATVSIPYTMKEFHPGQWMILVAGDSGAHAIQIIVPKVLKPHKTGENWRLDFNAARDHEKKVKAKEGSR